MLKFRRKPFMSPNKMALMLAMLSMLVPFSINAFLPALPHIADSLNVNIQTIGRSISSFGAGIAIGQLTGGAWSDVKGRRITILSGLSVYILATWSLVFIHSADWFIYLRFIQAVGLGMATVVVSAVVRDYYQGNNLAQMYAHISILVMAAPMIAPLLGAVVEAIAGWRAIMALFLLYSLLLIEFFYYFMPNNLRTESISSIDMINRVINGYFHVFINKSAMGFLFIQAASFSSIMIFITESPYFYMQMYELSTVEYSLILAANVISMAICNRFTAYLLDIGNEPQEILRFGMLIQLLANASLFALVWWDNHPPFLSLAMIIIVSIGTQGLISANAQTLFIEHFAKGGSASAVFSFGQSIISALAALMITLLHNNELLLMAGMMLTATLTGILLVRSCSRELLLRTSS